MIFRVLLAALALLASANVAAREATQAEIEMIRSAMADKLKDSESARFLDVKHLNGYTFCGKVNSKNSYGAYAGYSVFMAMIFAETNTALVLKIDGNDEAIAAATCKDEGYEG